MNPVADDDREQVLARLRDAVAVGAIDLAEFEHRAAAVTRVVTPAELDALVADIPADITADDTSNPSLARQQWRDYVGEWRWWTAGAVVLTAAWWFQGIAAGQLGRYWPAVPLGVWAAVLLAALLLPSADR